MIDFDYNRSSRILSNLLTKFFYLAVQSCKVLNLPNRFIEPILDQVCESVNDELFVMDSTTHEYFTVDITIDGEELSGQLLLDKFESPKNVTDHQPAIGICLIQETAPDAVDDLRFVHATAKTLAAKECEKLLRGGIPMPCVTSICISAGYITKICCILTDITSDFIMDTFLARTSDQEDFKNPLYYRMQIGMFVNTMLRELSTCIVHRIGDVADGNESGFVVNIKSVVRSDRDHPEDPALYETITMPNWVSFQFVEQPKKLHSVLFE